MPEKLRAAGWLAVGLLVLGQILPWMYRTRPAGEVWDLLFSRFSRPNPEWWIWFLAPAIAALLAARDLVRQREVSPGVFAPIAVFFITWAALVPTGVRHYLGVRRSGFVVTFIGVVLLAAVAAIGMKKKKSTPYRRSSRPLARS